MEEKASCRKKRLDINTFDDALRLIKDAQNIIVLTGAGCSVSCGIPDFRSKNGIYSRLDEFELEDPQQMFDIKYFRIRPETFYSFAKEIYPSNFKPSPSHMFIKLLEDKGKLLRNYTQNIDTLEKTAGIKNVVQCHGSFATATCIVCGHHVAGTEIEDHIFAQTVPTCPKCHEENDGIMKPDIVFFGEKLPDEFNRIFQEDRKKADLLIVMGSSLKVSPVADVKDLLPQHIPQILINLEALPHMQHFDIQLLGYCDKIIVEICRNLGWELPQAKPLHPLASATPLLDIEPFVPEPAPPQQGRFPHRHLFEGAVDIDNDLQCDASSACSSTDSLSDSSSTNSDTSDEEEMEGNFDNKQDMPCSDHLVDGIARHELKNCTIDVFSENDVDAELALCQKDDLMQNGILSLKRPRSLSPSGFSDLLAEHQTKFSNHGTKE
ncbi:NAD-dependent histone deacetylase sir2, variant 2 [Batrachochytrium dendrobatidis]|nr:NAD-dependent histone deacetylase sir2, variant 2 [Batrachochytrium dendrobatidis]KAK5672947.1 NAD-dependent histone deacetylase sir2, variant 2 [Batrachochytrium dendrobatidis]OAJ38918.1 hypothetical protein, variant 1 [Batrachochytrium dendrobatidis JEL423]OAJ38919.1 hypothetical protein, variant 2 [Batrachochytrium dendrobatidis JEL423]